LHWSKQSRLWEKELQDVISDPDARKVFRQAAEQTTEDRPFLRWSGEDGPEQEEHKSMIMNLL